jgi:hypothetical protein
MELHDVRRTRLPGVGFISFRGRKDQRSQGDRFRRRVLYAPCGTHDLRIGFATPHLFPPSANLKHPGAKLLVSTNGLAATRDPSRDPAIHVNQSGYPSDGPKTAMVGYYLGSLSEMSVAADTNFAFLPRDQRVVNQEVFAAHCLPTRSRLSLHVLSTRPGADFSKLHQPGIAIAVPDLALFVTSKTRSGDAGADVRARHLSSALRHGGQLPFTRFTHGPCHTAPTEVPTMSSGLNVELRTNRSERQRKVRKDRLERSLIKCVQNFPGCSKTSSRVPQPWRCGVLFAYHLQALIAFPAQSSSIWRVAVMAKRSAAGSRGGSGLSHEDADATTN